MTERCAIKIPEVYVKPTRPAVPGPSHPLSPVGANEPSTETGIHSSQELASADVGGRPEPVGTGREPARGAPDVQPELGRVPGLLERRVSAAERKAFDPEVKALKVIENNWKKNSNGESYRAWLTARRRSDLLGLVDGVLRP
jgi:hypothetical protein